MNPLDMTREQLEEHLAALEARLVALDDKAEFLGIVKATIEKDAEK